MSRLLLVAGMLLSAVTLVVEAALVVAAAPAASPSATATGIVFDAPRASGAFGEPVVFEATFRSALAPRLVELLTRLPGDEGRRASLAQLERVGDGAWRASVVQGGHIVPNTAFEYAFRVVTDAGSATGPTGRHVVADERVSWQRISSDGVTVWWHEGDRDFAERALAIAARAVDSASALLGISEREPVDFFIYADDRTFRQALGPATRENVGGEAHPAIRTLFGLIEPRQVDSDWVAELITHEISHIVFDAAVRSPYDYPPRWLNEGLAVYLSQGFDDGERAQVLGAARTGALIPLDGLAGQFPTRPIRFGLAYAESVAAVDHLVTTHGQDALVRLIHGLGEGATLDQAFRAATNGDFRAFEDGWLASLGAERPEPFGPRPGEPGPVPDAWAEPVGALLR